MNLKVKVPAWLKRWAPAIALAVIFGVAGYFITPQSAKSESLRIRQSLNNTQSRLKKTLAIQAKLKRQLADTQKDLSSALNRIKTLAEQVEAERSKLASAQNTITTLTKELDEAKRATEPLTTKLQQTSTLLTEYQSKLKQANARITSLTEEINSLRTAKNKLEQIKDKLTAQKDALSANLDKKNQYITQLQRYLSAIELGEESPDRADSSIHMPLGMPVTTSELIQQVGSPSMVFQSGEVTEMEWAGGASVKAVNGIVMEIDGKAASRETLTSMGIALPEYYKPADWRYRTGGKIYYADLVELFGKPERVAGTGKQLVAWWSIGAWGRSVPVKVSSGLVTEFAGGKPDGALCCQLVRHRKCAYANATSDVISTAVAAHDAYCQSAVILKKYLSEQAYIRRRDGINLVRWKMAPLDSVGTWIAFETGRTPVAIVRTWVDCTWSRPDGTEVTERRYAVINIPSGDNQQGNSVRCILFAPLE